LIRLDYCLRMYQSKAGSNSTYVSRRRRDSQKVLVLHDSIYMMLSSTEVPWYLVTLGSKVVSLYVL
jgi:hypothetical protein